MPQHFIMECPAYERERKRLFDGRRPGSESFAKLLTQEEKVYVLAVFIKDTGRFELEAKKKEEELVDTET